MFTNVWFVNYMFRFNLKLWIVITVMFFVIVHKETCNFKMVSSADQSVKWWHQRWHPEVNQMWLKLVLSKTGISPPLLLTTVICYQQHYFCNLWLYLELEAKFFENVEMISLLLKFWYNHQLIGPLLKYKFIRAI